MKWENGIDMYTQLCVCMCVCVCAHVHARSVTQLSDFLQPRALQSASSSARGIYQANILSGMPFPTPEDFPDPGIKPLSLVSLALAGGFFITSTTWEAPYTLLTFLRCIKQIAFPWWLSGKEPICQSRRCQFDPCVRKTSQRRKWHPTLVFLPGKSHGQRSLAGYSSWGHKRVG